ncbi:GNAT family N-acetyltransferase [Vibrio sp. H11]|uniref:GNAT family N-acetyltransferase n=1 Tax=Vibrio sp. H11 TaxID=2565928 RepID=UPI0010A647AB|nr:GNAT family N-acetyltransferase [Vibrio sp. H11]
MLKIRRYKTDDALTLRELFISTVHHINQRDYTQEQLCAWAPVEFDAVLWDTQLTLLNPYVVHLNGKIVGYADLQPDGLIDHFFCHYQHQGQGIGRFLMQHVLIKAQQRGIKRLHAHVSITARPFFEHMGFRVVKAQQVTVQEQTLTNYLMERPAW